MKNLLLIMAVLTLSACADHGLDGATGPKGDTGAPGSSCSVAQAVNGAVITCEDGSTTLILNGTNGVDAPPTAFTVTSLINVCGDNPGADEILLRLADGTVIAHYAGGGNLQFLAALSPGSYVSTDSSPCNFTLAADGTLTDQLGNVWTN